jgi:hypothetical protein
MRLQQELRAAIEKVTNSHTRALVAAWADAWDEIAPDLTAALLEQLVAGEKITTSQLMRSIRLHNALQIVATKLEGLARDAGVLITGDLRGVITTAGAAQASVIDSQLPPGQDLVALDAWSRVSERDIAVMVRRSTEQITSSLRPLAGDTYDVVRRELIRGIAAGSNPKVTARRMVARAEGRFNGQLGLTRALTISRTETLDAYRGGAALGMSQHADVLAGWTWVSELSTRTCASCWAMNGTTWPLSQDGPLDHQCGRCTRMPTPRSWASLGINIPEPPSRLPDAQARFDALSAAEQKQVLGPTRHAAYAAGDFPMSAWSVKRENPGWRDSYTVSPAPAAYRGGRSSRSAA